MSTTIYHETLSDAIAAGIAEALPKGHVAGDFTAEPMSYETSQRIQIPLVADQLAMPRKVKTGIYLYLYRMPSGRYEATAYAH